MTKTKVIITEKPSEGEASVDNTNNKTNINKDGASK